jgi:hypothetical protein
VRTDNDALFSVPPSVDVATGDLSFTPGAELNGRATVTVTLMDGGGTANGGVDSSPAQALMITVTAVNDAPTISDIADRTISINRSTGPITVAVGDVETAAGSLIVSSDSSNRTLVPTGTSTFGEGGITRTVTITPPLHQTGTATITVTVTDGELSAHDTFVLTVEGHVVHMPLALRAYR